MCKVKKVSDQVIQKDEKVSFLRPCLVENIGE